MQGDSEQTNLKALNQWADKLACPACFSPLGLMEAAVTCTGCGRIYPVVDGIPVLIADRAKKPDDESAPSPA